MSDHFFFNLKKGIVLFWLSSKLSTWSIVFTVRCCTKSGEQRTKVLKKCLLNLIYLPFEVKIMWSIFFTSLTCKMIVFCVLKKPHLKILNKIYNMIDVTKLSQSILFVFSWFGGNVSWQCVLCLMTFLGRITLPDSEPNASST